MKKNILVFPCGSEIGLEVNRALSDSAHFTLFGGSSIDDHGKYVYNNYIANIPFVESLNFVDEINKIIEKYSIDFIIPAHDSVVLKMSESQDILNAEVVTSCTETCKVCRSKANTYKLFEGIIPVPKTQKVDENITLPIFLKPDIGQGSKGTYIVNTIVEIEHYLKEDPTLLALEYLPGKEYTVDCFTDKNGVLLFAEGRERKRIQNGISVNTQKTINPRFQEIARIINKTLLFQGVWFYQVKERSSKELVLLEIAPRIAGSMGLFRVEGVNFIQLSLYDRMGIDLNIIYNDLNVEMDRALSSKFIINYNYNYVYIDFDDTLITNNSVNINVIKFIYQAKNMKKRIILLSKHSGNIQNSLDKFSVSSLLFDEIIILKTYEHKYDYIKRLDAVFIDDSFAERKEVFDKHHIPVFSLDGIEALII